MMYQQNISDKKIGFHDVNASKMSWFIYTSSEPLNYDCWCSEQTSYQSISSSSNRFIQIAISLLIFHLVLCAMVCLLCYHQDQCALVVAFINVYISCTFDGNFFQSMNTVFLLASFLSLSVIYIDIQLQPKHWCDSGSVAAVKKRTKWKKSHHSQWYLRSFNTLWMRRSNKKLGFIDLHFYEMSLYSWFFFPIIKELMQDIKYK